MKILRSYSTYFIFLLLTVPAISFAECDPDLSSGGECWTNCTTEDEITICDILDLDALFPESNENVNNAFQAKPSSASYTGKMKTKRLSSGEIVKGRIMNQRSFNITHVGGNSNAKALMTNDKVETNPKTTNRFKTSNNGVSTEKKCKDPLKEGGWCVKIDEIKTPPGW